MKNFWFNLLLVSLLTLSGWADSSAFAREAGWVPVPAPKRASGQEQKKSRPSRQFKTPVPQTVYDNQPAITESEVKAFASLLPTFRAWARKNGENAHPVLNNAGQPDFIYSRNAASWVKAHKFDPSRFFCIMGRMAAGVVIVEEGNDFQGTRPADMPAVAPEELTLVRKHLGLLLHAGGPPQPIR